MIPDCVILHCSVSSYGDVFLIDKWHKERGFKGVGYHAVCLNGRPHKSNEYFTSYDGVIEPGRPINTTGAHCLNGFNSHSLGFCLIGGRSKKYGDSMFTLDQLDSFSHWFDEQSRRIKKISGNALKVFGHHECQPGKTCPDLNMNLVRKFLSGEIASFELLERTEEEWKTKC